MAVRVRSRVAGVLRFLISMPLSRQVKRAGRIVSVLAMVTIVPASLVVASADLGQAIDKKRPELEALAAALTLEVGLSRETAREDRPDSSKGKDQPKTEGKEDEGDQGEWCDAGGAILPAEACVAAAEFGEAFEAAWGATLLEQSGARVRATAEGIGDARRAWARRQVLLESVARRTGTVNVAEATSRATGRRAWARGVLDAELKARTGSGPVTSFGKRAGEIFGGLARRVSGPVAMEVTDRPLTLRELASTAVAAGVGLSVDSAALGGGDGANAAGQTLVRDGQGDAGEVGGGKGQATGGCRVVAANCETRRDGRGVASARHEESGRGSDADRRGSDADGGGVRQPGFGPALQADDRSGDAARIPEADRGYGAGERVASSGVEDPRRLGQG